MNIGELIQLIVFYALLDSVDPCFFALLVLILSSTMTVNPLYAPKAGLTFIIAVYLGYVVFGIILKYAFLRLPPYILPIILLAYGLIVLIQSLRRRGEQRADETFVCREDDLLCRIIVNLKLADLIRSLPSIFLLGLISSFTLLPCSAGLYLTYNAVTRNYGFLMWLPFTLFYVAVFISPALILYLAFLGISKLKRVCELMVKNERIIKIIGSLIMITSSILLLS